MKKKQNGLGVIKVVRIKSARQSQSSMVARIIEIKEVSTYIIDELRKDVQWLNTLSTRYVVPVLGYTSTQT